MDLFNAAIDGILKLFFGAFAWAPPLVGLAVLSAAIGVAMLWVFGKTSNQARMKQIKRKVYASLLELRVFADEPGVTWRAQKSLFAANLRYMGLALKPAMWMILPMGLLILHMESFYGRAPLPGASCRAVKYRATWSFVWAARRSPRRSRPGRGSVSSPGRRCGVR
jgi:hypothetical protein